MSEKIGFRVPRFLGGRVLKSDAVTPKKRHRPLKIGSKCLEDTACTIDTKLN